MNDIVFIIGIVTYIILGSVVIFAIYVEHNFTVASISRLMNEIKEIRQCYCLVSGIISDSSIFDRDLTPDEIEKLYTYRDKEASNHPGV